VKDWARAQAAVFRNCGDGDLVLPDAAPEWADDLLRADRDYQTAAAHFYAMRYEEAAQRFRAIASDSRSPWRPYGRYWPPARPSGSRQSRRAVRQGCRNCWPGP
jgi:hypothetical protein